MGFEPRDGSPRQNLRDLPGYIDATSLSHAFIAWVFAISGPLLIILGAARLGGLPAAVVESWIFASYGIGGVMTIVLALLYRQPIAAAWSIAGAVLVGGFLAQHGIAEAVAVYLLAGVVCAVLGYTGAFKYVLDRIPLPIILGMVSGILLPLATDIVSATRSAPSYAGGAVASYLLIATVPRLARRLPPILWAIAIGGAIAGLEGAVRWDVVELRVVAPVLIEPRFDLVATAELLVPLVLTMIAVQDAQTVAILRSLGHARPPVNSVVTATGVGTVLGSFFGSHSYCTAPVMTGIVSGSRTTPAEGAYAPTVVIGVLLVLFALFSPIAAGLVVAFPGELVRVLGGLALIPVLSQSLSQAFAGRFKLGALTAFMVTASDLDVMRIGAPFWGIVAGAAVALLLERHDLPTATRSPEQTTTARARPDTRSDNDHD